MYKVCKNLVNFFTIYFKEKLKIKPKYFLYIFSITIFYFLVSKLGLRLAFIHPTTTSIWPSTGLALAAFLLFGYRIFPAIFLGALFTNITTDGSILTSVGIALGNTLEGIIGAYLIRRFARGLDAFNRPKGIFIFTILGAFLSSTISATIGVTSLLLGGFVPYLNYTSVWLTWWFGDASGTLIIAPFLILWGTKIGSWVRYKNPFELLLLILLLITTSEIVFTSKTNYAYLCFPLIIWIALRRSQKITAASIIFLYTFALFHTLNGNGPFGSFNPNQSLLMLQLFMAIISVTAMIISAVTLEKNKYQKNLENSQKHFKALIEKSYDAIVLINKDGIIIYASPSAYRILGYRSINLIDQSIFSGIHPDERKIVNKLFKQLIKTPGKSTTLQYRYRNKTGKYIWLEGTLTNLLKNKNVESIVANFHDITKRKQAEETNNQLASVINSSQDAIFSTTPDGIITSWNKGAKKTYGYVNSEITGKSIYILFPKSYEKELDAILKNIKKNEQLDHYETDGIKKDGTTVPVSISMTPVKDNKGNILGISTIARDITREKELERRKDEFISMASHELNTPITGISVYVQTLQKIFLNTGNAETNEYLSKMNGQVQRIKHLIRDLLDISRIRLGLIAFNYTYFNLNSLIKEVMDVYKYVSKTHKISIQGKNIKYAYGDRERIGQVLTNLLSNAIKYSPMAKKIIITTEVEKNNIIIGVQDFGIGISKKNQKRIFERFYRVEKSNKNIFPGIGIGLSLASQIIDQHQGKMWVKSNIKKGSTFYFSLPLKKP